jgi:hypothetical protein
LIFDPEPDMKHVQIKIVFLFLIIIDSCIVPYFPKINEKEELLVVEGLITDQPGINTVKLSKSYPLWARESFKTFNDCKVWITDNLGNVFSLKETATGKYVTDSASFRGIVGRKYTLHIKTTPALGNVNYESVPVEMKPVPPIDSIYYEKRLFDYGSQTFEGCQIYLDTHTPLNNNMFFRYDYTETWEFHLPYDVPHKICWISNSSNKIMIENSAVSHDGTVTRFPVNLITNPIDRLSVKYSILVKQYSLNEDEFHYWERLKNINEQVGGLYDIVPSNIQNNVFCVDNQFEKVLGYFSVSAVASKRIFIKDSFAGQNQMYNSCPVDTIFYIDSIPAGSYIIVNNSNKVPKSWIIANSIDCYDCRVRGKDIKPLFWNDDKK